MKPDCVTVRTACNFVISFLLSFAEMHKLYPCLIKYGNARGCKRNTHPFQTTGWARRRFIFIKGAKHGQVAKFLLNDGIIKTKYTLVCSPFSLPIQAGRREICEFKEKKILASEVGK